MSSQTSVVAIVTVCCNKCDKCGAELSNPQHRYCAECFKKLPRSKPAPKPVAAPKAAPAPVAAPVELSSAPAIVAVPVPPPALPVSETTVKDEKSARPTPERPAHIKVVTCGCGQKFVPRDPRHTKCAKCFKVVIAERKAAEAKREAEYKALDAERAAKRALLTAYRAGKLPEGAKVRENGAQVVIVIDGVSTTLYDNEGFNARREAERQAKLASEKAAADKARAEAEAAKAKAERHDRIAKTLFRTLSSGKALPPTVTAARSGVSVIFTVSVVGKPLTSYTATDPELSAAEDAARKAAEAIAKAARKEQGKKGGKCKKAA